MEIENFFALFDFPLWGVAGGYTTWAGEVTDQGVHIFWGEFTFFWIGKNTFFQIECFFGFQGI